MLPVKGIIAQTPTMQCRRSAWRDLRLCAECLILSRRPELPIYGNHFISLVQPRLRILETDSVEVRGSLQDMLEMSASFQ